MAGSIKGFRSRLANTDSSSTNLHDERTKCKHNRTTPEGPDRDLGAASGRLWLYNGGPLSKVAGTSPNVFLCLCSGLSTLDSPREVVCVGFGPLRVTKPYEFIGFGATEGHQAI